MVRPDCSVDAPPVVILEFDAMDAPESPLLAAIAGSGDEQRMTERKTAAVAATTGGWEWEFATIFMSVLSPRFGLAILAEEWPANPLPGETNAVTHNEWSRQAMPRSGKYRRIMMQWNMVL